MLLSHGLRVKQISAGRTSRAVHAPVSSFCTSFSITYQSGPFCRRLTARASDLRYLPAIDKKQQQSPSARTLQTIIGVYIGKRQGHAVHAVLLYVVITFMSKQGKN